MIVDKLNGIINRYTLDCNKIKLIANDDHADIKELMEANNIKEISSDVDDFDDSCVIIIWDKGVKDYDNKKIKFINEFLKVKKVFILIVPLSFDFHNLVSRCHSNSFDAISWRNDKGEKYDEYCIIIKND